MTFADLISQTTFDSGDEGAGYKTAARRWLNLARSYIADQGLWKSALSARQTITTAAATTDGLYNIPSGYDRVFGDILFDETNNTPVFYDGLERLRALDPDISITGTPTFWADAGVESAGGSRQVFLSPIPDGTYTIAFPAYAELADVTSNDDSNTTDNFFGNILAWSNCFAAGMRYYHDLNNNEDASQTEIQRRVFEAQIKRRKMKDKLTLTGSVQLSPVKGSVDSAFGRGRFDPAQYPNIWR